MEFQKSYRLALLAHKDALMALQMFWQLTQDSEARYEDLVVAVRKVDKNVRAAERTYRAVLQRNSDQPRLLRLYAKFLDRVKRDSWGAARWVNEAKKLDLVADDTRQSNTFGLDEKGGDIGAGHISRFAVDTDIQGLDNSIASSCSVLFTQEPIMCNATTKPSLHFQGVQSSPSVMLQLLTGVEWELCGVKEGMTIREVKHLIEQQHGVLRTDQWLLIGGKVADDADGWHAGTGPVRLLLTLQAGVGGDAGVSGTAASVTPAGKLRTLLKTCLGPASYEKFTNKLIDAMVATDYDTEETLRAAKHEHLVAISLTPGLASVLKDKFPTPTAGLLRTSNQSDASAGGAKARPLRDVVVVYVASSRQHFKNVLPVVNGWSSLLASLLLWKDDLSAAKMEVAVHLGAYAKDKPAAQHSVINDEFAWVQHTLREGVADGDLEFHLRVSRQSAACSTFPDSEAGLRQVLRRHWGSQSITEAVESSAFSHLTPPTEALPKGRSLSEVSSLALAVMRQNAVVLPLTARNEPCNRVDINHVVFGAVSYAGAATGRALHVCLEGTWRGVHSHGIADYLFKEEDREFCPGEAKVEFSHGRAQLLALMANYQEEAKRRCGVLEVDPLHKTEFYKVTDFDDVFSLGYITDGQQYQMLRCSHSSGLQIGPRFMLDLTKTDDEVLPIMEKLVATLAGMCCRGADQAATMKRPRDDPVEAQASSHGSVAAKRLCVHLEEDAPVPMALEQDDVIVDGS